MAQAFLSNLGEKQWFLTWADYGSLPNLKCDHILTHLNMLLPWDFFPHLPYYGIFGTFGAAINILKGWKIENASLWIFFWYFPDIGCFGNPVGPMTLKLFIITPIRFDHLKSVGNEPDTEEMEKTQHHDLIRDQSTKLYGFHHEALNMRHSTTKTESKIIFSRLKFRSLRVERLLSISLFLASNSCVRCLRRFLGVIYGFCILKVGMLENFSRLFIDCFSECRSATKALLRMS